MWDVSQHTDWLPTAAAFLRTAMKYRHVTSKSPIRPSESQRRKSDFATLVRRRARLRFRSALTNEFDVLAGPKPQPSAGQPLP
jgi:hypothetical protein